MKTRFIVNPRSGRAVAHLSEIRAFADRRAAEVVMTTHRGHATELAADAAARGIALVVAVGGDGTLNEVASALVGTDVTLGLVPCGSGDGLGRHLGIHGPVRRALNLLDQGHSRWIDSGTADGHPFFTAAGIGFEAEIAARFNRLQRRGFLRYLSTAAMAWREWQPREYEVTSPFGMERFRAFTLVVANANQYGNGAKIAPRALVDDGALDLTAIPPITLVNALPMVARLFGGRIDTARGLLTRRAGEFRIVAEGPMLLHTDGEVHSAGSRIEFRVRPASLRILVPPG
ncbi:MAG TPA: diacylglycerol kinase family protein [Opitutaceae bacterium]|nr:diacylglycerol kinase family protein [Opitutaceae bacterium]